MKSKPTSTNPRSRPKKATTTIGIQKTAKVATTRAIKSAASSVRNPLGKVALIAGLDAIASYFIYKEYL